MRRLFILIALLIAIPQHAAALGFVTPIEVEELAIGAGDSSTLELWAYDGGSVDLSGLQDHSGVRLRVRSEKAGSLVDLSSLDTLTAGNAGDSNLVVIGGGEIRVSSGLTTLDGVAEHKHHFLSLYLPARTE